MDPLVRFEENKKLVYYIINRYYPAYLHNEDIEQTCLLALWKACSNYNESSNYKFSTYASRVILNEIRMQYRDCEAKPHKYGYTFVSLESPIVSKEEKGSRRQKNFLKDLVEDKKSEDSFNEIDLLISAQSILSEDEFIFFLDLLDYPIPCLTEKYNLTTQQLHRKKAKLKIKLIKGGFLL